MANKLKRSDLPVIWIWSLLLPIGIALGYLFFFIVYKMGQNDWWAPPTLIIIFLLDVLTLFSFAIFLNVWIEDETSEENPVAKDRDSD